MLSLGDKLRAVSALAPAIRKIDRNRKERDKRAAVKVARHEAFIGAMRAMECLTFGVYLPYCKYPRDRYLSNLLSFRRTEKVAK